MNVARTLVDGTVFALSPRHKPGDTAWIRTGTANEPDRAFSERQNVA
jgi:hypothetical protein